MRVLISSCSSLILTRKAVLKARELKAPWATPEHLALVEEPTHFAHGVEDQARWENHYPLPQGLPRHDPFLLQIFDELGGREMSGWSASGWSEDRVVCIEVPDDVTYHIAGDISEYVSELHRQWDNTGEHLSSGVEVWTKDSTFPCHYSDRNRL